MRDTQHPASGFAGASAGEALRIASAEFTATLVNIDLYVSGVRDADQNRREDALGRLPNLQIEARARYETLRLLGSRETQPAGRMALRHAWAMWRQAVTGEDPRSDEYSEIPCGDHLIGILGASYGLNVPDAHPRSSGRSPQPAPIRLGRVG